MNYILLIKKMNEAFEFYGNNKTKQLIESRKSDEQWLLRN